MCDRFSTGIIISKTILTFWGLEPMQQRVAEEWTEAYSKQNGSQSKVSAQTVYQFITVMLAGHT